jgi:hypothetical protein
MPTISAHNWTVEYRWSTSSGLVVGPCAYMGVRVLHDAAVPFVYVNYAGDNFGPFTDELRSTSRKIERREIMHGFDLKASYDLYSDDYLYEHVLRFHDDGQFASRIVIQGPGEENGGRTSRAGALRAAPAKGYRDRAEAFPPSTTTTRQPKPPRSPLTLLFTPPCSGSGWWFWAWLRGFAGLGVVTSRPCRGAFVGALIR